MLIENIKRQLEYGGYRIVRSSGFPCQILIKKSEIIYAVCLIEDTSVFNGQSIQLDYLQHSVRAAVEKQFGTQCKTLALIISNDVAHDKALAQGVLPTWLIDWNGTRIVFDNQPGTFGGVEVLLEKKPSLRSCLFSQGTKVSWVTLAFVLLNVIVQIVVDCQSRWNGSSELMNDMVLQIGSFLYKPQYYRLLSSAFLHFGWTHLFNNMLVLLFLGRIAESLVGKWRFLLMYLVCAIGTNAASVMWYGWNGEIYVSTAGASGAVFAVAGMILALIILKKGQLENVSLRQIGTMMFFTIYHGFAEGGVNNCAHITGALMGFIFGVLFWLIVFFKKKKAVRSGQETKW